ncbi:ABC-type cobalt transport system, ATPase component [Moorella thermoacetica Y72]|uniref:ABC-type cobalt transport system, ATPase component n=1 Tax=Moorella thermoacetica Y72 TaxID=1325331 RepID=A0A0S6UFN6_NEOTH|nr:hypothetical protein [Moorella thermoacetica]GAF26414.1 ABC-type cobalt transport system, ATPase component [Moorella thermoacetica Y72]
MSLIEIRNLEFTYKGGTQPALKGIDLDINPGEFIVIMGHSDPDVDRRPGGTDCWPALVHRPLRG